MTKQQLEQLLSKDWCDKILKYIALEEINNISAKVNKDRLKHKVIPDKGSDLFFKAFRCTQYSDVKVVILGQDLYHTVDEYGNPIYDGLAFSNSTLLKPQPSLRNILTEVKKDYPVGDFPRDLDELSLYRWAAQGVLLINTAHTVIQSKPGVHIKLWEPFAKAVIEALNDKNDLVWLLWGRSARNYKSIITNTTHCIIETSHPSPLGYDKPAPIPFKDSCCFKLANKAIESRNIKKIKW